jgi:hypothetical protein
MEHFYFAKGFQRFLLKSLHRTISSIANSTALAERDFFLIPDFCGAAEQQLLIQEAEQALRKASWSDSHFDSMIRNYRECMLSSLAQMSSRGDSTVYEQYPNVRKLKNRIINQFFDGRENAVLAPHVLELSPSGYILPHIDNVRRSMLPQSCEVLIPRSIA